MLDTLVNLYFLGNAKLCTLCICLKKQNLQLMFFFFLHPLQSLPGGIMEHQHLAHHVLKFISIQSEFGNHQLHPHVTHVYNI